MTVRDSRIPSSDADKKKTMLPQGLAAELGSAGTGAAVDRDQPIDRRRSFGAAKSKVSAESGGSSEEMESPRSLAGKWMLRAEKKLGCLHSQVLRIREEDLHLGEDIGECLSAKDKVVGSSSSAVVAAASRADIVVFSRPILPCSPLSGKVNPIQSVG
ncbi:uncharacterized protein LOC115687202 [Syzygium oleosum]|uniref:uncharacterized protein LOC115687202 n=1 Tax=Syzygium oleosum TaxID=219896 RepID=UPI0024BBE84B|nr:uncharacterized protein LOC115687202 [Syzygium oleosum]